MDDAAPTVDQAHLSDSSIPESPSDKTPEPTTRPFVQYTRAKLLHLSKSPLVKIPDGMPAFKDWFGEWGESGATNRKDAASDSLSQLARDRTRFRRDTEEGDGTRESLSSGRPTFKNALSFSQASGSAMGSMGSFRHPSSLRLDSDARREEREREREREGRRDTENLRNLSVQFDRERRDREAAPHLPRAASGASSANGRDGKARDQARDSRENTKDSARENRRGRGDDTNDWRRARDDDRQRSRSRPRDRLGRGDREPANGQKRERDSWVAVDDRRGAGGASGRRRGGAIEDRTESKSKDDRGLRNDRDKSTKEEQEPAWMGDYVPETAGQGMLGSGGVEDGIQAWKRELKEKERGAQGGEIEALEDDSLGGLEDEVTHMTLVEKKASHDKPAEDDGLDEIQRFKKLMQESDRKRREEAERNARELAGKFGGQPEPEQSETTNSVADIAVASTLPGPPGLTKSASESLSAPTPPPASDTAASTNGRVGGISLASPNWPMSSSVAPSTTAAVMSPPGWTQSSSPLPDAPQSNPRLSPVQPRRFTQDGNVSQMGNQDGSQVGTRSTSRFANFFGDKQRDPTAPRFNDNPAPNSSHSPSFLPTSNEPQLLDSLLARLAESQTRPQSQTMAQNQDRAFSQRVQAMPSQQPQYGNALGQNPMNTHAQPPLIQHQRQQLSMHQQQQQLLSSLNASNMLPTNASGLQSMSAGGPSSHMSGLNSGVLNPSLNLDVDGRFVSDNLVPGLRPRNGSVAFDEDFQVNSGGGMGRMPIQQHRPQQSFDALHGRPQPQQTMYNVGNRTPSGGYRNGPSPIGGHNPNPMQRGPDLPQYLAGMAGPLGGAGAGNTTGPQQQYSNRLGAMANLGGMLGAGGPANQPRFDERQRMQQSQNAPMHHQPGQSLSGMGGLPLDFGVLQQQQQPSQRQMPRVGGYGMQQTQAPMGPRSTSGHHGQYPGHMHNDFVVQPNQGANTNDIMAMFLASQGNNGMGA